MVTYRQRETDTLFLDDILKQDTRDIIFIISWGFDIPKLIKRLKGHNIVYHAHSSGYGFNIPSYIPIITVSHNTMGYWGQKAPHSPIYYLPNQISDEFCNLNLTRDIDVLVLKRKSSRYLLEQLVPRLESRCKVVLITNFVEDITKLFNHSKVYLYDSAEYWGQQNVSEGFGLQPMEAMACGCQVFSSLNGGLSDYLDPEFNCQKIAVYSTDYDVLRILKARLTSFSFIFFDVFFSSLNLLKAAVLILHIKKNFKSEFGIIFVEISLPSIQHFLLFFAKLI